MENFNRFNEIVNSWLEYKHERGDKPYTQRSLESFCDRLLNLSNGDLDVAQLIIEQSIANNYAGIFPVNSSDKAIDTIKSSASKMPAQRLYVINNQAIIEIQMFMKSFNKLIECKQKIKPKSKRIQNALTVDELGCLIQQLKDRKMSNHIVLDEFGNTVSGKYKEQKIRLPHYTPKKNLSYIAVNTVTIM